MRSYVETKPFRRLMSEANTVDVQRVLGDFEADPNYEQRLDQLDENDKAICKSFGSGHEI